MTRMAFHTFVFFMCSPTAILPVIHDLRVLYLHFSSPFVYIDKRDFLREYGEVGLVLEIRERSYTWGKRKLCLFTYLNTFVCLMVFNATT